VAVVGGSGCGKTTLLKLLAGLLQPTAGEIRVDGEPLARLGLDRYRAMIGVVMQDDQLFAGSLADNISFFSGQPNQRRIEACARMAAVHEDIAAMPMSYGTLIGGQKQRVFIARALYREPSLLLLDEATSHLDIGREHAVNAALRASSMTRVVIAHRPDTIRASDRVITLDRGKVVQPSRLVVRTARPRHATDGEAGRDEDDTTALDKAVAEAVGGSGPPPGNAGNLG